MKDTFFSKGRLELDGDNSLQVILTLYDGAIDFLEKSVRFAENNDIEKKNLYIQKANDIILELDKGLDLRGGGEVGKNLKLLYSFMNRRLVDATMKETVKGIVDVKTMMNELRESWRYVDESLSVAVA